MRPLQSESVSLGTPKTANGSVPKLSELYVQHLEKNSLSNSTLYSHNDYQNWLKTSVWLCNQCGNLHLLGSPCPEELMDKAFKKLCLERRDVYEHGSD